MLTNLFFQKKSTYLQDNESGMQVGSIEQVIFFNFVLKMTKLH